jgi:phospholipase A-2-activating protein
VVVGISEPSPGLETVHRAHYPPNRLSNTRSAIVWKASTPVVRLTSHLQAVWDVKYVAGDKYLTASADKLIRLYSSDGALLHTYAGHTDCVRSLALTLDGRGFWSAGNDAYVSFRHNFVQFPTLKVNLHSKVILWHFGSTSPVKVYSGHESFVYSVAALSDGSGCVSAGEDSTVRIWQGSFLGMSVHYFGAMLTISGKRRRQSCAEHCSSYHIGLDCRCAA